MQQKGSFWDLTVYVIPINDVMPIKSHKITVQAEDETNARELAYQAVTKKLKTDERIGGHSQVIRKVD